MKDYLFNKFFKDYTIEKFKPVKSFENHREYKNMFGLAGVDDSPLFISMDSVFQDIYGHKHKIDECESPLGVRESLLYEFIGPTEHWCEVNCQGKFGLSFNDYYAILYLENHHDRFLWNLTFGDKKHLFYPR